MMASKTLRLNPGDADERISEQPDTLGSDNLEEPLLGNNKHDDNDSEGCDDYSRQDLLGDQRRKCLYWMTLFSHLITHCTQGLAKIITCSGLVLKRFLSRIFPGPKGNEKKNARLSLSPIQEERLRNLQQRLEVPFDGTHPDHQDALKVLWRLAYPGRELPSLKSELWKEMGWQSLDPSTDFRGGGIMSLENLIFFAMNYPDSFQRLLHKKDGKRSEWEYPFAAAGINISFMLTQILDLQSGRPTSKAGICFLELLGKDEMAFDKLYCVAFQLLDAQWLVKNASYMEFGEVLKSTRTHIERELALHNVSSIKDLPAYSLLNR